MTRPAIFFDRDNTLILNDGFLGDPSKVVLMDGAAETVVRARNLGFAIVTISNQSGVARGMFEEEDVQRVNARMDDLLAADDPRAVIDRHEYCPFHPDGVVDVYKRESDRRKPGAGMLFSAAQKLELDLKRSWVIGDMPRDIQAGKTAGCRTILLRVRQQAPPEAAAGVQADFTVDSLQEAMDMIEKDVNENTQTPRVDKPWLAAAQRARAEKTQAVVAVPTLPPPTLPPEPAEPAAQAATPGTTPATIQSSAPAANSLEQIASQILAEMRRRHEQDHTDFSVTKLLAGIVQIMALAAAFLAYLRGGNYLEIAIFLETLTIALLIMGRQR